MKERYETPGMAIIVLEIMQLVCFSLNGGTEPMSTGDIEEIVIDSPYEWD